jgi:hypothetical protein
LIGRRAVRKDLILTKFTVLERGGKSRYQPNKVLVEGSDKSLPLFGALVDNLVAVKAAPLGVFDEIVRRLSALSEYGLAEIIVNTLHVFKKACHVKRV